MKLLYLLPLLALPALAQQPRTGFAAKQKTDPVQPDLARRLGADLVPIPANGSPRASLTAPGHAAISPQSLRLRVVRDTATGLPIYIENRTRPTTTPTANANRRTARISATQATNATYQFLNQVKTLLQITRPADQLRVSDTQTDDLGQTHVRLAQVYRDLPVYGAELVAHLTAEGDISTLNGRYQLVPDNLTTTPALALGTAVSRALTDVGTESVVRSFGDNLLKMKQSVGELCLFPGPDGSLTLAYALTIRPNLLERWQYVIDAQTGAVLDKYNNTCGVDGPAKASVRDLNGVTRALETYSKGGQYYLIDASRKMYSTTNAAKIPDGPLGVLWTVDAKNTFGDNQKIYQNTSTNNTNWLPTATSAHYNAGIAYNYYLTVHGRNSLNDKGATIISVINVADPDDGKGMDNAFWNGELMAYGNGRDLFKPIAGSLDVSGHEMTHGVIQNTAGLEYKAQSGAINESMADVFGVLIDRDDWNIGEDVVLAKAYPSGALRNMANPNQGGKNDPGYQPKTMGQYINTTQDNGGVHINSGIPNYAFYLFATAAGMSKDKAEKVYYRALKSYLVRTSQFIDLRLAILKATADLYGNGGTEYKAAQAAFDAVGIVEGQTNPNPKTPDVPTAQGQDLLLFYSSDNKLYSTVVGTTTATLKSSAGLLHRPSVTDNGQNAVYVGTDKKIRSVTLTGTPAESILSSEAVWNNAAISKDGTKLAALTAAPDGSVWVYSYTKQKWKQFKLYNPTSADGVNSGAAKYADSFEWDFTGEYIVYDGYNELTGADGSQISYWDVGFIRVWDTAKNDFGDGKVEKLFSNLDEGESVGNPSYSKNSPDIIGFDYLYDDGNKTSYYVVAADLNTGDVSSVYENNTIGYPSYSRTDGRVVFESLTGTQKNIVAINLLPDRITPTGALSTLISKASWPVWYTQAVRNLPQKTAQTINFAAIADRAPGQFTLSATASSGLPVLFTVMSGPADIVGNSATLTGPGAVTIRAYQEGNGQYLPATPVDRTFNVLSNKTNQSITFGPLADRTAGGPAFTLTATASSNLPVTFIILNGPATLTGNSVSVTGAGRVTVRAAQAGNTQYNPAASVDQSFSVLAVLGLDPAWADALKIYPNPATAMLSVELPAPATILDVTLTNLAGATVQRAGPTPASNRAVLDVRQLPTGLYTITVQTASGMAVRKLIRE